MLPDVSRDNIQTVYCHEEKGRFSLRGKRPFSFFSAHSVKKGEQVFRIFSAGAALTEIV